MNMNRLHNMHQHSRKITKIGFVFLAFALFLGTITLVVATPPVEVTADAGGPYSGFPLYYVFFDGSGSSTNYGTIVSYEWDFGDGNTGTGVAPQHGYATTGVYTVTLTVTNDIGNSDTAQTTATISSPVHLVADAGGPYTQVLGSAVQFDGSGSSSTLGPIYSYHWDFGDGNTGTGSIPNHVYAAQGVYTVTLTITNEFDEATDVTTATIKIPEFNAIPEVPFGTIISFAAMGFALFGYFAIKKPQKKKQME